MAGSASVGRNDFMDCDYPVTDSSTRRARLFGLDVDALTLEETAQRARNMAMTGGAHQHVVLNAAKIVAASKDQDLTDIIRSCHLVSADGMSVVWASRLLGVPLPERVAGIDLMTRVIELAAQDGAGIYLLGAEQKVIQTVASALRAQHRTLRIAGVRDGYWAGDREVVDAIRRARPDYLFLGIPSPRKEFWLQKWLPELSVGLVMGVGGSFDVLAGARRRAPQWAQNVGLEWLWRFAQEPRRMWRRYLVGNTQFLRLLLAELVRSRASR